MGTFRPAKAYTRAPSFFHWEGVVGMKFAYDKGYRL